MALALLLAVAAAGCTGSGASSADARSTRTTRPQSTGPVSTAPAPTTPTLDLAALPACWPDASLSQPAVTPVSGDLAAALDAFVADARVGANQASVSVWVDGLGEVLTLAPDLALAPASNQKLVTAMGALAVIGPNTRLVTQVRLTGTGQLVIEAGGDPTLASTGAHSLAELAAQVRASGLTLAPGGLLVDETRLDGARRAAGWEDRQIPADTGPLSAFMVDDNLWSSDPSFLTDPALFNADRFRDELAAQGVTIAGPTAYLPEAVDGFLLASLESGTIAELLHPMLLSSDNQIADLLLKDIGVAAGGRGSMDAGAAATRDALAPLCVPLNGVTDDGSGLSHRNARSARELRSLVQAARTAPWWPILADSLPTAGQTGTLAGRMRGTAADGTVHAKTGSITGGAALTGVGTTAGGRAFVFSVIVNGPGAEATAGAIDNLVAAIAGSGA